ncbi:MAG: hypothetical protein FWG66_06410 [Spirochaetes bacterium]|nr:hypothetical protein [Spirochaetota bacterium]
MPVTAEGIIGRSLLCKNCGKDLRVCKNCRFFLPGSRGDCSETNAEPVPDKERANFCDWFSLEKKQRGKNGERETAASKAADAKTAFDDLFK